jgi:hypothetical protein
MAAGRRQRWRRTWVSGLRSQALPRCSWLPTVRRKCSVGCRSMECEPHTECSAFPPLRMRCRAARTALVVLYCKRSSAQRELGRAARAAVVSRVCVVALRLSVHSSSNECTPRTNGLDRGRSAPNGRLTRAGAKKGPLPTHRSPGRPAPDKRTTAARSPVGPECLSCTGSDDPESLRCDFPPTPPPRSLRSG